jgi:predicted regulator of Ras-like GTPase activity (Roadblock/LC7/MglB family)
MPQLSSEASDFSWLVGNFASRTPGVAHAMVVSADGLPVAVSERLDRAKADQLAAIASGLASLTQGGARCMDGGLVTQTVVEMDRGLLVVMAISDGSCLAVLAGSSCDVGVVAYEMTVLVSRSGDVLTPSLRAELPAALPPGAPTLPPEAVKDRRRPTRAGSQQQAGRAGVTGRPHEASP